VAQYSRRLLAGTRFVALTTMLVGCGPGSTSAPVANPATFQSVSNLGNTLNTPNFDGGPSISADGLQLYFVSDRDITNGGDIWMASRTSAAQPFGKPVKLGTTVNSSADEGAPSISADGLELFFDRAPDGHIFVATRSTTTEPFGPPALVDLGNDGCCDGFPDISSDGLDLYFCSSRPGGYGGDDVWRATRPSPASPVAAPQNLGPTVNGGTDDCDPAISKDGLQLFIASDRKGRLGGLDLWVLSRPNRTVPFGNATNLGRKVNSGFVDRRPAVSADGSYLLFMSDRSGGSGFFDLWQATRRA
jgi:Tol biopolymer transport system component